METYFSTFVSGMQDFIPEIMKERLNNLEKVKVLDGGIFYRTSSSFETIKDLRFFNNSFLVLKTFEDRYLEDITSEMARDREIYSKIGKILRPEFGKTFRIIFSNENNLVSMDQRIVRELESKISRLHLKVDRSAPDMEFWFLKRREGVGIFMLRLTKHRSYEKVLQKGELRPEVASVIVLLSEPSGKDIALDPFFGHGSLVIERAKYPHLKIIAIDNEPKKVFELRQKVKSKRARIEKSDSLDLEKLDDNSIDKIITDPPWGLFKKIDLGRFYERMIHQFSRILKKRGIAVLMTAQKELAERIIARDKTLTIEKRYDILVSGKKAAIYKIRKH